jgi:hypothetical protein
MVKIKQQTVKGFIFVGGVMILIGPVVFSFSLPLTSNLCQNGVLQCGYINLGYIGYSFYAGIIPFLIGIILFATGHILKLIRYIRSR